jgi:putative membrane protein
MDDGWGLVMMFGLLAFGVLIALAVGLAVVWAARSAGAPSRAPVEPLAGSTMRPVTSGAEQILAERMARGEIDTEEYRARLEALRTGSQR